MPNRIRRFGSAALLAAAVATLSFSLTAQEVPKQIPPAANEPLFLRVHAKGDQIYTCKADGAQFTWTLKAPDAQLFDKDGKPFGKHLAGLPGKRTMAAALPERPLPMRRRLTPIPFHGFSSAS